MLIRETNPTISASEMHWAPLAYSEAGQIVTTIEGSEDSDLLEGTLGDDAIRAFGGFDTILGSSGIDTVDGGASYDTLTFLQYHRGLNMIGAPRSFTVGADFVRDGSGDIDTTFAGIESVELIFVDLPGDAASSAYVFDLSGFIGDGATGRTRVSVNDVPIQYTGSVLGDSLFSSGGYVTADGGEGFDDFVYAYTAGGNGMLSAGTDQAGRIVVTTGESAGAVLTSFEAVAFQGSAVAGGSLTADFSALDVQIDWLSSEAASQSGAITVIGTVYDDTFQFGWGTDTFTGQGGYNTYRAYALWDDFNEVGALFDGSIITDFSALDTIDLSYSLYSSVPATFIGPAAFSGRAGEVRYEKQGDQTLLMSDGNGDGMADATLTFTNGAFDLIEESPGVLVLDGGIEPLQRAVASDLDGNGTADLVFRSGSGALEYWLIDGVTITGSGTIADSSTDRMIATGDFDGDGKVEPLFRTRDGALRTEQGTIGNPSDGWVAAAVGDLDGDGKADVVLRNEASGAFAAWLVDDATIRETGDIGNAGPDYAFLALADFDGDGRDDMLFRDAGGTYAIWRMAGTQIAGGGAIGNPGASWFFAGTGDFDGDGNDDLLFRNVDGSVGSWQLDGTRIVGGGVIGNADAWILAGTGDYNGDGKDDVIFRDAAGTLAAWHLDGSTIVSGGILGEQGGGKGLATDGAPAAFTPLVFVAGDGTVATWLVSGTGIVAGGTLGNPGKFWTPLATGDLSGMGTTSILFRGQDGRLAVWESDGRELLSGGGTIGRPGPEWSFRALADFNGDGRDDILFQNTNGDYFLWNLASTRIAGGGSVGKADGFEFVEAGDFDGDGKADILLREEDTGEYAAWLMSGTTVIAAGRIGDSGALEFAGLGDFNGDGSTDILFRDAETGVFSSWTMDGLEVVGGGAIGNPGQTFELAHIADINRDGRDDLIFQSGSGQHSAWMLADTRVIASGSIGSELADWGLI